MLASPSWAALQQLRTLRHTYLSCMGQTYGCSYITGRPVISSWDAMPNHSSPELIWMLLELSRTFSSLELPSLMSLRTSLTLNTVRPVITSWDVMPNHSSPELIWSLLELSRIFSSLELPFLMSIRTSPTPITDIRHLCNLTLDSENHPHYSRGKVICGWIISSYDCDSSTRLCHFLHILKKGLT